MRNVCLLLAISSMIFVSCTKTTTNNYTLPSSKPAFAVNGINDLTFTYNFAEPQFLSLTVQYLDSVRENVSLSVSGLPDKVVIDTAWVHSGIPDYSTMLTLYDTAGMTPGTYPVTLTATTASGKQKEYVFNMRVLPMPTSFFGKYNNCDLYCSGTLPYADSVYPDPGIPSKIWFANYGGSGHAVFGLLTGQGGGIYIPTQTIGGNTYTGSGNITLPHSINISISTSCALNMF